MKTFAMSAKRPATSAIESHIFSCLSMDMYAVASFGLARWATGATSVVNRLGRQLAPRTYLLALRRERLRVEIYTSSHCF